MANCDSATVAIDAPGFAGDVTVADEGAQVLGGGLPSGPSIGARLGRLGRVDSAKTIGPAIDLERIAVNHTGRLSDGGRGSEREGSSQGKELHRLWLTCDCGDSGAVSVVDRLHVDACIQEQRDAKGRNQQPRRVSPEMASKPRDMCHGALLSQCPPLTW